MPSIEDIITLCKENYAINLNNNNKQKYINFLNGQLENNNYDMNHLGPGTNKCISKYPYVNLLINKTLLFAYMTGDIAIIIDKDTKKRVSNTNDLYLLSTRSIGVPHIKNRPDIELSRLYYRVQNRSNWSKWINEIGKDPEVLKYFNRKHDDPITYNYIKKQANQKIPAIKKD